MDCQSTLDIVGRVQKEFFYRIGCQMIVLVIGCFRANLSTPSIIDLDS